MPPNLRDQTFVSGDPSAVIVNAHVINILDEIVLAFLKAGDFFSNAMLQPAVDRDAAQQSTCVSLAFLPFRPEGFDFAVINVAAQHIA